MPLQPPLFAAVIVALIFIDNAFAKGPLASSDMRITPERLGLPKGNTRTSEPFVTRIYRTDEFGMILRAQPSGYPFTIDKDYDLKDREKARVHEGVDLSSRAGPDGKPEPLEFKSGTHGMVVHAREGDSGMIAIQVADGSVLEFLHTSVSYVKVGDVVEPNSVLGVTGGKGASTIHLHIQAKSQSGTPISPDLVYRIGQQKLKSEARPPAPWPDFDPENSNKLEPALVDGGKVQAIPKPKSHWIVEVLGVGGKVDQVLGEFPDQDSANACEAAWYAANPDDIYSLTRAREVKSGARSTTPQN